MFEYEFNPVIYWQPKVLIGIQNQGGYGEGVQYPNYMCSSILNSSDLLRWGFTQGNLPREEHKDN